MQSDQPNHYQRIADYLARQNDSAVALTFLEIEAIISAFLPTMATINPGWWTTAGLMQVRTWREYGWRAYPDIARRQVRFVRDAEEKQGDRPR